MSPHMPIVSGVEIILSLSKSGFVQISQKGSHVKLKHTDGRIVIVPLHRELAPGTFRSILRQANWSIEEFIRTYRDAKSCGSYEVNTNYFKVIIQIQAQSQKHLQSTFNELTNQLRDKARLIYPLKPFRLAKIPTTHILQHYFLGDKNGSGKNSSGYH